MYKNLKIFSILILFLLTLTTAYSIAYFGERTEENYCKIQIFNDEEFEIYRDQYSLTDFINATYQEMVQENFSSSTSYEIPVLGLNNLDIIFTTQDPGNSNLYGLYSHGSKFDAGTIRVYIEAIHDDGTSQFWTEDMILNKIENTLLHEIAHYLDLKRDIYGNDTQTAEIFNINGTRDVDVYNLDYFIDLYNQTNENPNVPVELRESVQYDLLFTSPSAPYDNESFFTEIVARTSALCLYTETIRNYSFSNENNYYYCNNNFNISDSFARDYENIIDRVMITWFYFEFPGDRTLSTNLDGICAVDNNTPLFFQTIHVMLEEFTEFLLENYLELLLGLICLSLVISLMSLVVHRYEDILNRVEQLMRKL